MFSNERRHINNLMFWQQSATYVNHVLYFFFKYDYCFRLIDWCLTSSEQFFSYIQDDIVLELDSQFVLKKKKKSYMLVLQHRNHIENTNINTIFIQNATYLFLWTPSSRAMIRPVVASRAMIRPIVASRAMIRPVVSASILFVRNVYILILLYLNSV